MLESSCCKLHIYKRKQHDCIVSKQLVAPEWSQRVGHDVAAEQDDVQQVIKRHLVVIWRIQHSAPSRPTSSVPCVRLPFLSSQQTAEQRLFCLFGISKFISRQAPRTYVYLSLNSQQQLFVSQKQDCLLQTLKSGSFYIVFENKWLFSTRGFIPGFFFQFKVIVNISTKKLVQ